MEKKKKLGQKSHMEKHTLSLVIFGLIGLIIILMTSCCNVSLSLVISDDGGKSEGELQSSQSPSADVKADIPVSLTK